uniref:C-type lectin domain-containing protein n=1 Tax=Mastacembelus armatus TaxID=205130 RepID=A0A3Q3MBQ8_9TELE
FIKVSIIVFLSVSLSFCLYYICAAGDCDCRPCPAGWSKTGPRCFRFFNTPDTWSNAESACIALNANLASVRSKNEQSLIKSIVQSVSGDVQTAWIGGNDAVKEGVWRWSDGSRFVNIAWATGEPNNLETENCMEIYIKVDGYNDLACESKRPYVCGFTQ